MLTKNSVLGVLLCSVMLLASAIFAWSDTREDEVKRIDAAADALNEIVAAPDKGIPEEIMESAVCVGVVPSLKKGRIYIWRRIR